MFLEADLKFLGIMVLFLEVLQEAMTMKLQNERKGKDKLEAGLLIIPSALLRSLFLCKQRTF